MIFTIEITNAFNISCVFDRYKYPPPCNSITINKVTSPNDTAIVVGKAANFTDSVTTNLRLFDSKTTFIHIPTGLFNIFKNLTNFNATSSSISTITTNAFGNCSNLEVINLEKNPFPNLPNSFASKCANLKFLRMSGGGLKTIDKAALRGLVNLDTIILSFNQIECIPAFIFIETKNLRIINLQNNKIQAIHSGSYSSLIHIAQINLQGNFINYIPKLELKIKEWKQPSFEFLLQDNPIIAISPVLLFNLFNNVTIAKSFKFNINFKPKYPNITTCINLNAPGYTVDMYLIEGLDKWEEENKKFNFKTKCYKNFTEKMGDNSLVTC